MLSIFKNHKLLFTATLLASLLFSAIAIGVAFVLQNILDAVINHDTALFETMLWVAPLYILVAGIAKLVDSMLTKLLVMRTARDLRKSLFHGIIERDNEEFGSVNTADYLSAMTNDTKIIEENLIVPILQVFQYIFVFFLAAAALFYYSPLIAGIMFLCLIAMYLIPGALGKPIAKRQDLFSKALAKFTIGLKDKFSGYDVIRSYQLIGRAKTEFDTQNTDVSERKFGVDRLLATTECLSQALGIGSQFLIMLFAGSLVLKGSLSAGVLLALIQLSGSFVQPIMVIMQNLPIIKGAGVVMERIQSLSSPSPSSFVGCGTPEFQNSLRFLNVTFGYNAEKTVLDDLYLSISKGHKYAIVGANGCGKSTLINLLCAGYGGYNGDIMIDGQELHELDISKWLEKISVIHQNVYMFDDTIKTNIALHNDYREEEWQRALSISGVDRFLDQTENGLDTIAGENGMNLSGGQRQRIAVARALIGQKEILVLDEGTAAIDKQTAYEIETALLMIPDVTIIAITHNLDPQLLRQYDMIMFMENGKTPQCGTFDELINEDAAFRAFIQIEEKSQKEGTLNEVSA